MYYFYIITGVALAISFLANRQKTLGALRISCKRFATILPAFLIMLISVSIVLFLIPEEFISSYLGGDSKLIGFAVASFLGSITLMPGFIAFPMAGILLRNGVSYMVLSAFTTTLMMVGVLTYPIEKEYFGTRVTIIRNSIGLLIAIVVAIATGICFGEIL